MKFIRSSSQIGKNMPKFTKVANSTLPPKTTAYKLRVVFFCPFELRKSKNKKGKKKIQTCEPDIYSEGNIGSPICPYLKYLIPKILINVLFIFFLHGNYKHINVTQDLHQTVVNLAQEKKRCKLKKKQIVEYLTLLKIDSMIWALTE